MDVIKRLVERAKNPWWTFAPGPDYVAATGSRFRRKGGPGLFAQSSPGAFNVFALLFHLREPHDHDFDDYFEAVPLIMLVSQLCTYKFDGLSVSEQAVMLDPLTFIDWLEPHIIAWNEEHAHARASFPERNARSRIIARMRSSPIAQRARLEQGP